MGHAFALSMVRGCSERVVSVYRTGVSDIYGKGTTVSGLCQYMALGSALPMVRDCNERVMSVY